MKSTDSHNFPLFFNHYNVIVIIRRYLFIQSPFWALIP